MSHQEDSTNATKCKNRHLNYEERCIIERQLSQKTSKAAIARLLVRDISTIKREIKRGTVKQVKKNTYCSKKLNVPENIEYERYFPDVGQKVYDTNRLRCGAKNKILLCSKMVAFVEEEIKSDKKRSPDSVIGYAVTNNLFPNTFTTKTYYNWIDDGLVNVKNIDLILKLRRKPKSPRRERKRILGKSIDERPASVLEREEFGHWEGDGIVGKGQQGHLITLVERKFGFGLLYNVGDKNSDRIVEVVNELQREYGEDFSKVFKSMTFDNGSEFAASQRLEVNGRTNVYYAHPYSSFERGTNENWNGIVRRFIPKGSSFENISNEDVRRIAHYINTLPRKRFGYKTPLQMWEQEVTAITNQENK